MEEEQLYYLSKTELIQMIKSLTKRNEALQHLNTILTEDVPSSISRTLKSALTNRNWRGVCSKCTGPVIPLNEDDKKDEAYDEPTNIKRECFAPSSGSGSSMPTDLVVLDDGSDSFKEEIPDVPDLRGHLDHVSAEIVRHGVCVSTVAADMNNEVLYRDLTFPTLPELKTDGDREVKFIGQIPYLSSSQMFAIESCGDWKKLISIILSLTYTKEELASLNATRKRTSDGDRQVMSEEVRSWIFNMVSRLAPNISKAEITQNISYKIRDARKSFKKNSNRMTMKDNSFRNDGNA